MKLPIRVRTTRSAGRTQVAVSIKNADIHAAAVAFPGYISRLKVRTGDHCVAEIISGARAARDPLFKFEIEGLEPGTELALSWQDNRGFHGSASTAIT